MNSMMPPGMAFPPQRMQAYYESQTLWEEYVWRGAQLLLLLLLLLRPVYCTTPATATTISYSPVHYRLLHNYSYY